MACGNEAHSSVSKSVTCQMQEGQALWLTCYLFIVWKTFQPCAGGSETMTEMIKTFSSWEQLKGCWIGGKSEELELP